LALIVITLLECKGSMEDLWVEPETTQQQVLSVQISGKGLVK